MVGKNKYLLMFILFLRIVFKNTHIMLFKLITRRWSFVIILFFTSSIVFGQYLEIIDGQNITNMIGDELSPKWSYDSKSLLFQSNVNGKSNIFIYQFDKDTTLYLSNSSFNFRNPVWHPDGDKIIFDSNIKGADYLYVLDLKTKKVKPLFDRTLNCKNPAFSKSSRQVYFNGWDELTNRWEVYSYDFIYDNLNKLTDSKLGVSDPDINSNGKLIVYGVSNPFSESNNLEIINWYGDKIMLFDDFNARDASWGPLGLKVFFVSSMDGEKNEVYSIWKDGSHLERLTKNNVGEANPVVSPDGSKIAMSVQTEKGWDIIIIPFDDY